MSFDNLIIKRVMGTIFVPLPVVSYSFGNAANLPLNDGLRENICIFRQIVIK